MPSGLSASSSNTNGNGTVNVGATKKKAAGIAQTLPAAPHGGGAPAVRHTGQAHGDIKQANFQTGAKGPPSTVSKRNVAQPTGQAQAPHGKAERVAPRPKDVEHDGRADRFKGSLIKAQSEYRPIIAKAKEQLQTDLTNSSKESTKKFIEGIKKDVQGAKKQMNSMNDRAKPTTEATKTACQAELSRLKAEMEEAEDLLALLAIWLKDPINPSDWIARIDSLEKRGFPMASITLQRITFEQRVKMHIAYNQVTSVPIPINFKHPPSWPDRRVFRIGFSVGWLNIRNFTHRGR